MSVPARTGRSKLSTTVDYANFQYLETLVERGEAHSLADAVDRAVRLLRRMENRKKLEQDTAVYFAALSPEARREEDELSEHLKAGAKGIDYDLEA